MVQDPGALPSPRWGYVTFASLSQGLCFPVGKKPRYVGWKGAVIPAYTYIYIKGLILEHCESMSWETSTYLLSYKKSSC